MKRMIGVLLALVLVLSLAACGTTNQPGATGGDTPSGGDSGEKGKIGVLMPSLSFDFQAKMAAGVKRAANEFGFGYQEVDYNADAELQLSGMETLMASGVKAYYGIFFNRDGANEMFAANPDVATISQGTSVKANAFVRDDFEALAAHFIECLDYFIKENGLEGGDVAALWLPNSEDEDTDAYLTKMIVRNVITDYCDANGLNYVSDQYPNDDEEAANVTEQMMNAYPNLRYLFCFNNGYAIAAANEIASAVSDVSEYCVFSSEGDDESFRLVTSADSPYRGLSYNDVEPTGYQVGLQLINWVENGTIEDVYVSRFLIDSRNISEFLG